MNEEPKLFDELGKEPPGFQPTPKMKTFKPNLGFKKHSPWNTFINLLLFRRMEGFPQELGPISGFFIWANLINLVIQVINLLFKLRVL